MLDRVKKKYKVAVLGSGNIGTDLMYKILKNDAFELMLLAGIDPQSDGLARARSLGVETSTDSIDGILDIKDLDLVFDATSAKLHKNHAPRLEKAGIRAIDMTPAQLGPPVVPCVNMESADSAVNVNLISCAAQATIPIVHGFSRVGKVHYAEIVATVASKSGGKGTRDNIEEFTHTTARALRKVGNATEGKAMVVLNPAEPPVIMRNSIYARMDAGTDLDQVRQSILSIVAEVQKYVPGYRLVCEPFWREDHFMATVEVEGAGDYLPVYAGNLDIINAAAIAVAERFALSKASAKGA